MNYNAPPRSHQRMQPEEVHSETDMNDAPRSFELSNEDFPVLPGIRNPGTSAIQEFKPDQSSSSQRKQPEKVYPATDLNDNSRSFELSSEDFPDLASIRNTRPSTSKESKQDQSSSPSQRNIEFGTYSIALSLKELNLGTKDQQKEKSPWSDEKKD